MSLPGVVSAKCGARVILSDSAELPVCLGNCRRSCAANGLTDVTVMGLTWGDMSPHLLQLPALDVILGSDVFYEPEGPLTCNVFNYRHKTLFILSLLGGKSGNLEAYDQKCAFHYYNSENS